MGLAIDGKLSIDEINESAFRAEAEKAGLNVNVAMRRFENMASKFESALKNTALLMKDNGFYKAEGICQKILKSGGYAK